jgi:hypothetical protein
VPSFPTRPRTALRSRATLVAIAAGALAPAIGLAQGGVIRGTVTDPVGGTLGYSVVSILPEDHRFLTDDVGRFVLSGLAPGSYRLRARHLGYLPLDTVVTVGAADSPPLELHLTHVTVRLTEMRVVARGPCLRPGPPDPDTDLSLAIVFGELRENADRAIALGAQFPFIYRMQRRVTEQMPDGNTRPAGIDTVTIDGDARWTYRRGQVIAIVNEYGKPTRQVNIPGLVQLADSGFHNAHCFTYGGVEKIRRKPYIRVDFTPDRLIDTPDIEGSVYLDPNSYQISRIVMSLTHPEKLDSKINELTVTSSFREIVTSIAILDSAEGVTTFEVPRGNPMVRTERQKMVNVVFTRGVPPGAVLH